MPFPNLIALFAYIESFTNLEKSGSLFDERNYRLDRMQTLLDRCGHPERNYKIIHIAGTKGKGSTAAFIAAALRRAGYRTGLYTSPHVSHYWERIDIGDPQPDEAAFLRIGEMIREVVETAGSDDGLGGVLSADRGAQPESADTSLGSQGPPTTFELLTLLAFCFFREKGCQYAVIETGIGGRLDATNVVTPEICLITPIELEHTDVLGDTLELIAAEKGGIIKPGVPVFSAPQESPVRKTLQRIADQRGCDLFFLDEALEQFEFRCGPEGTELSLSVKNRSAVQIKLAMIGKFQAENAALAYLSLNHLLGIPGAAVCTEAVIQTAFAETILPARMELISEHPPIVLDSAHTPRSVDRVLEAFRQVFGPQGVLLFGSVAGKDSLGMAKILAPSFRRIIITTPGVFKESHPREVLEHFQTYNRETEIIESPKAALQKAVDRLLNGEALLITGSFYLAAEIADCFAVTLGRGQS